MNVCRFHLKVQQVENICLFELIWGKGQQLSVAVPYNEMLTQLYQEWQQIYLNFYKTALRGKVVDMGSLSVLPIDWHAKLVQAEATLLYEFHHWLRSAQLYEVRAAIASFTKQHYLENSPLSQVEIFLTCQPLDLAKLPWEAWEIGTEFATTGKIRLLRTPANIQETVTNSHPHRRGKARVLAILGDDTGLNFKADKAAVKSLASVAEIEFIGWQPGQDIEQLKQQIVQAIADNRGWDILFFAGHSNETKLTGGQLAIAPNVALALTELAPSLTVAKQRGLQFALFNSCNGLSIANSLIDLGLSQVAVMREPIHNRVAQEFLVGFLQAVASYKDVGEALIQACQYLKLEKHLTYPSAYLIPSLFCHPDAKLFRLEAFGIKQQLQAWLPRGKEAIALAIIIILSLLPDVQDFLLERRIWLQSIYRQITHQIPVQTPPPVVLIQIDKESLNKANIDARKINPLDRQYLASLIDKLSTLNPQIIGLDYVLDSPTNEDPALAKAVDRAIDQNGTKFVFATISKGNEEIGVIKSIVSLERSLQGNIRLPEWYVPLLASGADCDRQCPFAYLLALAYASNLEPLPLIVPRSPSQISFQKQLINYLNQGKVQNELTIFLHQLRLPAITSFSRNFKQLWWQPIIDFSIPPNLAYQHISAWQLLKDGNSLTPDKIQQKIVLIAAGGYDQAGVTKPGSDNFDLPMAIAYWRSLNSSIPYPSVFTGAEAHAYALHHLLTRRLVFPIADLWMVGVAALLGKGIQLLLQRQHLSPQRQLALVVSGTTAYGLLGLQVYISAAVLVPWFLPSTVFWMMVTIQNSKS
jgi:CHASE2 domain-containing sensor protein